MSEDIKVLVRDGVQVIRLTRAEKKNALTRPMYAAMTDALDAADRSDEIACTVFLGLPGAFSAGNDMNDFKARAMGKAEPDKPGAVSAATFIRKIPRTTKPMIAAVDGLAVGVGVTMLLHCDLVYASPNARFTAPFLNLGLIQEAGSSVVGPQRLSYVRAFELLVMGETWGADQAFAAGLVNAVLSPDQIEAHALKAAAKLAGKPRQALVEARRLLKGDTAPIFAAIDAETQAYARLLASPEAREAFSAFLEKRAPDFAGVRAAAKKG